MLTKTNRLFSEQTTHGKPPKVLLFVYQWMEAECVKYESSGLVC